MPRRFALPAAVAVGLALLTGCMAQQGPDPDGSPTDVDPTSGFTPAPEPVLDLEGGAEDNLGYFDLTNTRLIAAGGTLDGRAFIDNLVAAGFPKSEMEVTPDRTSIGGAADNVTFSVRLNGTCLIGQYGNIPYNSTTADVLSTGRCLVGTTRPIDW